MTALDIIILAAISAKCPVPEIKNYSRLAWTSVDTNNIDVASNRCKTLFTKKHCLTKFHKTAFQQYRAVCGKRE